MSKVQRYKSIEELSPSEHAERQAASRQGMPEPKFERDEYRQARNAVLEAAGLESDDDSPRQLADRTPQELARAAIAAAASQGSDHEPNEPDQESDAMPAAEFGFSPAQHARRKYGDAT